MKKLLLFLFTLFSIQSFGQSPALEMLIFPKYIESLSGLNHYGIPYVYRARITGLLPGKTYRYQNKIVTATTASPGAPTYQYILPPKNVPAGTADYQADDFYMPPLNSTGLSNGSVGNLSSGYGELTADATGSYTGWFIQETVKDRAAGATVLLRISLNSPPPDNSSDPYDPTAIAYTLHSPADQPLIVLGMAATDNAVGVPKTGTAIRSTAATAGNAKNFVFLYDNVQGTGRPIAGTFMESDGVQSKAQASGGSTGLAAFYYLNVNGVKGAWGTMILNSDANGIRRIEQRSLEDGAVVGYNTSADGTWASGAAGGGTVATAGVKTGANTAGTTSIVLDGAIVSLAAVKSPQTVAFTNTFLPAYTVGNTFTLSASSTAGLSNFQYTVVPATGILEITGNTVSVVGAGTAVITVTEPGNTTTSSGSSAPQTITVEGTPQAITGLNANYTAVYGDQNLTLSATGGASGNPVVYTSANTAIAEVTGGNQIVFKKAGTVTIKANQAGSATYSPAPEQNTTLVIGKASLDVIAEDKTKTKGAANPVATFVYGAFKGTDDASSVTGTPVLTIDADDSTPAGKRDITVDVSGMTSEKYTFNPVNGSMLILDKLDQVLSYHSFPSVATYGSQPLPFEISSNSTNEITFSSSNPGVATVIKNNLGGWAVNIAGAGEADITASQAEDAAYAPGTAVQHITVAKAPLSIIAEDKAKLTGEADPAFTARYEGFVNNEDAASLSGTLVFTKTPSGSNFVITPSGLTSENYQFTYVNGTLTVGNIAFAPVRKVYGDAAFSPEIRSATGSATFSIADPSVAVIGGNGLVQLRGAGVTSITATFTTGESASTSLTVDQKMVTVTADAQARLYGQANPELTAAYSGLVNNESEAEFSAKPEITTMASEASPVGRYTIAVAAAVARNYRFTYVPGILTINQASLVVKAADQTKVYGQENPVLLLTYQGLAPQDNAAALNLQTRVSTNATAGAKVASYPITVTGLTNTPNYAVSYSDGILSVTPAALNIRANNAERAEGQSNPVFAFTYTGFVNNDKAENLSAAAVATTTASLTSPRGTYPITVSGAVSPNYSITYTDGQLVVKGLQTIVFQDLPAVSYGDANFTPAVSSETGLQPVFSSDNLNVATIVDGRVKIIAAGTANISATFPATATAVAVTVSKPLVVTKRTLLVRADSKTRLYGQANPPFTASYDGLVNGETVATAVAAQAILTTAANPLSPAGTYTISGSAASAQNYAIVYEPGVLTVDKAVLTVTADSKTRSYAVENPPLTLKYSGFVNAENISVIESPALATTTATAGSPAGNYPINVSGGADENYAFNYINGILSITATTRTIAMDPLAVKVVGDGDFVPSVVLSSGEIPVFTSADASIATIVNNQIHIAGAGNVTITAMAPANASYATTPSVSRVLIVNKVPQAISFETVPALKNDGAEYTLKATSTSGLPVTFTLSDPDHASLHSAALKGLRIGTVQVIASQAGDSKYAAAALVQQTVEIVDADGEGVKVHPALSVNGDGINDHLTIDGIKSYPVNKVTIINRTGIKVFDIEGYDNETHVFAGKSRSGELLPQGTYFCLIEYNADSKQKRKTGYFILKY